MHRQHAVSRVDVEALDETSVESRHGPAVGPRRLERSMVRRAVSTSSSLGAKTRLAAST